MMVKMLENSFAVGQRFKSTSYLMKGKLKGEQRGRCGFGYGDSTLPRGKDQLSVDRAVRGSG